jgi:hypothetical protein
MYLFLSPKSMLLRLKIPLPEEEAASSSKPTLDHPNLAKGEAVPLGLCIGHALRASPVASSKGF